MFSSLLVANGFMWMQIWRFVINDENLQFFGPLITARIRRMGEGNIFSLFTLAGGGGYPVQSLGVNQNNNNIDNCKFLQNVLPKIQLNNPIVMINCNLNR